ncbi:hypothetical protein [Streptomyces sp. NPDC058728]|uniref:hypothetical protein n=1 Tax=Streptomyces sp. NPDC058728 TaxID=3346612 RepID=UPI003683E49F
MDAAARAALAGGEVEGMSNELIADAAAALAVLLTAAKPRGGDPLRAPRQREQVPQQR